MVQQIKVDSDLVLVVGEYLSSVVIQNLPHLCGQTFEKNIDMIVLFTDGAPNNGVDFEFRREVADKVIAVCQEHPRIPVNVVAMGDYFNKDFSGFLLSLTTPSGGAFVGR